MGWGGAGSAHPYPREGGKGPLEQLVNSRLWLAVLVVLARTPFSSTQNVTPIAQLYRLIFRQCSKVNNFTTKTNHFCVDDF